MKLPVANAGSRRHNVNRRRKESIEGQKGKTAPELRRAIAEMRSEREEPYEPYRLYRKIANATKTAVMIQRTILLLLLLFSSAIAVKYTIPAKEVQVPF
ncbi:MAG: hypothetical protein DMG99_05340 [Acidobacteria bacterium]|nr:MAG: hypothetical protein DMG99_05340 [Acidobacteriota bacterium]